MKISDVLWKAADEFLNTADITEGRMCRYSCDAVMEAAYFGRIGDTSLQFLHALGCPTYALWAFEEFLEEEERQQARYNWLMFAYEVAREEGL